MNKRTRAQPHVHTHTHDGTQQQRIAAATRCYCCLPSHAPDPPNSIAPPCFTNPGMMRWGALSRIQEKKRNGHCRRETEKPQHKHRKAPSRQSSACLVHPKKFVSCSRWDHCPAIRWLPSPFRSGWAPGCLQPPHLSPPALYHSASAGRPRETPSAPSRSRNFSPWRFHIRCTAKRRAATGPLCSPARSARRHLCR